MRFRVDDAAWVQTAEYLLDGRTIVTGVANRLRLADDAGSVHVGIERPIGVGFSGVAAPIPGVEDVFTTTTINRMVVRASARSRSPPSAQVARRASINSCRSCSRSQR